MSERDKFLRPMLDAGSSRVFNCCDRFRKLRRDGVAEARFFKYEPFHKIVVIKEANLDPLGSRLDQGLLTKLYFPYNTDDIYEGGRSIFLHDPNLMRVLNELLGLRSAKVSVNDIREDLKILDAFGRLPSLDAFLMRDALELDGFAPNPLYLDVSDDERIAICAYIRQKFEPLVCAAFDDPSAQSRKVTYFVDKLWEAKDSAALDPLIKACRFPPTKALSIFSAWKGIYYYTYEYERLKPRLERFREWIDDLAGTRYGGVTLDASQIAFRKKTVSTRIARHGENVDDIVREYEGIYDRFLIDPEATAAFINFLRRARELYWRMGEALSALNHAVNCWELSTAKFRERRLPTEQLQFVMDCLVRVLAGERQREQGRSAALVLA